MSVIVEDGSARPDANSYVSESELHVFHLARARDTDNFDPDDVSASLVKASEYVDKRFGKRYRGQRRTSDQSMLWPRIGALDDDGYPFSGNRAIPSQLRNAVCEYAWIVLNLTSKTLLPNPAPSFVAISDDGTTTTGGPSGRIVRQSDTVGPISQDIYYDGYRGKPLPNNVAVKSSLVNDENIPEYPTADLWIEQIIESSSSSTVLVRGD